MAAAVEQNPAVQQRISRAGSGRLADQAATAALYVTHPERSIPLRESTARPDTDTSRGSRSGLSNASAVAALAAHARKQDLGARQAATLTADRQKAASPSHEGYPYQAAVFAINEGRGTAGTSGNRKRAESVPLEAAHPPAGARVKGPGDPFDDLDKYMNASRIQNVHMNRRLFTATPPIGPEMEEHRKRSILEAASMSMAKDNKDAGLPGAQRLPAQGRAQRSSSGPLQQALTLQDVAQKRAAEKLAKLKDETAEYRNYYGVEQQPARSSFTLHRHRLSGEAEQFDIERSKEIRKQMTNLQSKLNAVDEKRENDRATLLDLARKNVDATIQDMDKRLYTESGRTLAMQKYLDEKAQERAQKGMKVTDAQYLMDGKISIGGQKHVEMADMEHLARSRLQPTFDEIEDLAQTQKAREVEARLDEEQRQHLLALEREREAEIQLEERQHKEYLKQERKYKEEKSWPWKRKSRQARDFEWAREPTEERTQQVNGTTAVPSQTVQPQPMAQPQPEPERESQQQINKTQVAAPGAAQPDTVSKQESKLKSWFSRIGRRASASLPKEVGEGQEEGRRVSEPATRDTSRAAGTTEGIRRVETQETETSGAEEAQQPVKPEDEGEQIAEPVAGVVGAPEGDSRAEPLRSNPVTASDLSQPTQGVTSEEGVGKLEGMTPSEYLATERDSKEIVEQSHSLKQQRHQEGHVHELATPSNERQALRDTAAEHDLPAPPSIVDKPVSNGARESRFSEDL
ncbi:uncharacterized protein BJX67DRAFT_360919 [Aspergillus lucknowensis]|uniref:Eisosome protein 1 n=1 Tax=Aspergillus lucknowensis TaxID=176173 RepID=A0ABR4LJB0_9EURO